jgi:hypothetical protein
MNKKRIALNKKRIALVLVPIASVALFALYRAVVERLDFLTTFDAALGHIADAVWTIVQSPISLAAIALYLLIRFGQDQLIAILSLFTEIGGAGFRGTVNPRLFERFFGRTEQDDNGQALLIKVKDEIEVEDEPGLKLESVPEPVPDVPEPIDHPRLLKDIVSNLDYRLVDVLLEIGNRSPSWEELHAIALRVFKAESHAQASEMAWYYVGTFHSLRGLVLLGIDQKDADKTLPPFSVNPDAIELLEARKAAFDKRKEKYAAT